MVRITIVTVADLNQLITGGPHIVATLDYQRVFSHDERQAPGTSSEASAAGKLRPNAGTTKALGGGDVTKKSGKTRPKTGHLSLENGDLTGKNTSTW